MDWSGPHDFSLFLARVWLIFLKLFLFYFNGYHGHLSWRHRVFILHRADGDFAVACKCHLVGCNCSRSLVHDLFVCLFVREWVILRCGKKETVRSHGKSDFGRRVLIERSKPPVWFWSGFGTRGLVGISNSTNRSAVRSAYGISCPINDCKSQRQTIRSHVRNVEFTRGQSENCLFLALFWRFNVPFNFMTFLWDGVLFSFSNIG